MQTGSVPSPHVEEDREVEAPLEIAPSPGSAVFRAFSLDHSEADAAAVFLRDYGQPHQRMFRHMGLLKVGPVPSPMGIGVGR